jgi:hypothetical protein
MHEHGRTRRGLSAGEASAVPFEDWFLPGQAPAGRSRSVHPRAEYDRPVRVTFPNTGPGEGQTVALLASLRPVSTREDDAYELLRPPPPTPADEVCSCARGTPVKLVSMGGLTFNPIRCLDCNGEVPPERLGLSAQVAEAVARWLATSGPIDALELQSGAYEAWARAELLNLTSPANVEGLAVARQLNDLNRCYFSVWESTSDDDWEPRSTCPICDSTLTRYDKGIFPQLLCEQDSLVLVGR